MSHGEPADAEDIDECDWEPPPEVEIIESEVLQIPSGLPSLDEFVRKEIEREEAEAAAAAAAQAEAEAEKEGEAAEGEAPAEAPAEAEEAGSAGEPEEPDEGEPVIEVPSEDEFDEIPITETKKPTKPTKKSGDEWYEMEAMKLDFGEAKQKAKDQAREELMLYLVSSTHNYLNNLINKVVEKCEYEDPDEILRTRLNKHQLCKELEEKLLQLDVEQKVRFFLNRKTVDYFRRKRAKRQLTDDPPETVLTEMRKYRKALMNLNKFKGREIATKSTTETKRADLMQTVTELKARVREGVDTFEQLVKKIFGSVNSEKMDSLIDYLLTKMSNMRKEISEVRLILIQRQHSMATLLDKARKLEDLGNGLKMMDFEHLQTENQALGKKIEERNNELSRLHARRNADIHTIAHMREKILMIKNTIAAQQETYDELIEEKQHCREYVNTLKLQRGAIRRESQRISFLGGLLDKPDLLLDYDESIRKASILRAKTDEMKQVQQIADLNLRRLMRLLE